MSTQGSFRRTAVACALTIAALAPAAAQAAEVHVEGPAGNRTIVFTGAVGEANSVLVDRDPGFTDDKYQLEDQDNDVSAGPGCENKPHFPSGTEPDIVTCDPAGVKTIRINLGNGNDSVRFGNLDGNVITDLTDGGAGNDRISASNGPSVATAGGGNDDVDLRAGADRALGGDGKDELVGGPGPDTIAGDDGADVIRGYAEPGTLDIGTVTKYRGGEVNVLSGGAGNDTVEGDNGPDKLSGGADNDKLHGGGGGDVLKGDSGKDTLEEGDTAGSPNSESVGAPIAKDVIHGGAGADTATYCTRRNDAPLSISLDRKANDGRKGERDNIGPKGDVENVLGGGESNDKIRGNKRANVLSGDCLTTVGASGNNKIFGLDGNDKLVGGDGRDTLDGGGGRDAFVGNEDADTIKAKDGTKDRSINCDGFGAPSGSDKAFVDAKDPNAASCETVKR
jgi:Ca2+-binding RTX toxin-like protein